MSLKDDSTSRALYASQKDQIIDNLDHYTGCRYNNRSIPIDECYCDCYERQIFMAGYELHRRQMYQSDPRKKT